MSLTALSPVDGRYQAQTAPLAPYFSEFGLIRYRVRIEVEYFIALCALPLPALQAFPPDGFMTLRHLAEDFDEAAAAEVKNLERTTNHDVKAVEYYLKQQFVRHGWEAFQEFIHFGLTSQDINNTAIPLSLREGFKAVLQPQMRAVRDALAERATAWREVPMLARTHGQPASPTRLGKELMVFVERLDCQLELLTALPFAAKLGGATGNFNAHHVAYPDVDWPAFADRFVAGLGLRRSRFTTQIEHYDLLAAFCDNLRRIGTILIDLDRDCWQYISAEYFRQKINPEEVGSSAMPHKVNPIDFENSEGNLGLANALFDHLSHKLPISRLQRDLTDSTVLRNLGVPLAHLLIALHSLQKGLDKLELNPEALRQDLHHHYAVVAEGIQTVLRREGYPQPYEALKALTRTGEHLTAAHFETFIAGLNVSEAIKTELRAITPENYVGVWPD